MSYYPDSGYVSWTRWAHDEAWAVRMRSQAQLWGVDPVDEMWSFPAGAASYPLGDPHYYCVSYDGSGSLEGTSWTGKGIFPPSFNYRLEEFYSYSVDPATFIGWTSWETHCTSSP